MIPMAEGRKGYSITVSIGVIVASMMVLSSILIAFNSMGAFGQKLGVGSDETAFWDVTDEVRNACQNELGGERGINMKDFKLTNTRSLEAFSPDGENNGGLKIEFSNGNTLEEEFQKCSVSVRDLKSSSDDSALETGDWKLDIYCSNCEGGDSEEDSDSSTPNIVVEGLEPEDSEEDSSSGDSSDESDSSSGSGDDSSTGDSSDSGSGGGDS